MIVSRRSFLRSVGVGGAALTLPAVTARGLEAAIGSGRSLRLIPGQLGLDSPGIRIDSNENPYGPAPAAIQAMREIFEEANRYPDFTSTRLREAIAGRFQVPPEQVLLGTGSSEILKVAVETFTSASRGLVTAAPTFELPATRATSFEVPVTTVPVDAGLRLDLEGMTAAAGSAGLVFLCNPNNPTGTLHGTADVKAAIDRILRASPDCMVLVDEAYFEYVEDPGYYTLVPLALEEPRVIVSRTFSKIYGMAGLRVGYALGRPETLGRMMPNMLEVNINVIAAAAAWTSLGLAGHVEAQRAKNEEAKAFTRRFFESAGYTVIPSATNFMMVDIRRDVKAFKDACAERGLMVGRPFPPLATHLRVSMGTMDEMRTATGVFQELLA